MLYVKSSKTFLFLKARQLEKVSTTHMQHISGLALAAWNNTQLKLLTDTSLQAACLQKKRGYVSFLASKIIIFILLYNIGNSENAKYALTRIILVQWIKPLWKITFILISMHASCPNIITSVEKLFFHKVKECLTQPEKCTGWEDEVNECKRKEKKTTTKCSS